MTPPRLRVRQLRLNHLHIDELDIAAGECVALSGSSGSGKSMLLRAIADLDPHQGQCWLDEQNAGDMAPSQWRRQVAYLAADNVWWYDRVEAHFGIRPDPAWLTATGLAMPLLTQQVAKLSSGERQRLALLRLLVRQPPVLLLDEPTASLDPDNTLRVETFIDNYRHQHAAAVIWVSHDPGQIRRIAQRHYCLSGGRLQEATS